MIGLHIAGVPVEEILLPALAAAGPAIALAWLELRARIKRLTDRRHSPTARAAAPPSTCSRRRGVGRHALGFGTMSSVDRSRVRELMGEVMTAQGRAL
ncbi:MAG: hypothetical protein HOV67_35215, partial [Kribbellaceae bacterium]|nr:hypothetical protein [Kribbellaceae bacterium]